MLLSSSETLSANTERVTSLYAHMLSQVWPLNFAHAQSRHLIKKKIRKTNLWAKLWSHANFVKFNYPRFIKKTNISAPWWFNPERTPAEKMWSYLMSQSGRMNVPWISHNESIALVCQQLPTSSALLPFRLCDTEWICQGKGWDTM